MKMNPCDGREAKTTRVHGSPRSMEVGGPAGNNAVLDSSGEGHHCFRGFAGGPCGIGDRVGCRLQVSKDDIKMMRLLHVARKAGGVSTDRCLTVTEAGVEQMRVRWAVCTTGAEKGQWRRREKVFKGFGGAENKRVGFLVGPRAILPSCHHRRLFCRRKCARRRGSRVWIPPRRGVAAKLAFRIRLAAVAGGASLWCRWSGDSRITGTVSFSRHCCCSSASSSCSPSHSRGMPGFPGPAHYDTARPRVPLGTCS